MRLLVLQTIFVLNKENLFFMIMSGFKSRRGFNGVCTVYVPEGWKNYARHGKAKGQIKL